MPEQETAESADTRSHLDVIKKVNPKTSIEYWMARDLQLNLGYDTWENFHAVILRAIDSCDKSGVKVNQHFRETTKMVTVGNGAVRSILDYFLSKHASHLIAMNGEPSKPEIAFAQTYFSIQTLKQERHEQMTDEDRRIELRDRVKTNNRKMSAAAMNAGVSGKNMPVFHAAGYQGLYGGRNRKEILNAKGLSPSEDLLDRAGSTELAANDFRITQTKDVLDRKGVLGESTAITAHRTVGMEVRSAIAKIGGVMPENLIPEISIKKIESERKKNAKLLARRQKQVDPPPSS